VSYRVPPPVPWQAWLVYVAMLLSVVLVLFLAYANLFGPCSWLMWQPVKDVPARCLRGLVQ
jgi:hypothetical protein